MSSSVLIVTIGRQVYKQWRDRSSQGVSRWLFVGQMTASAGFTAYSWLVHNWVFVVTNALLFLSAGLGFAIVLHHRRRAARTCREAPPLPWRPAMPASSLTTAWRRRHDG
jgi:MtN3 and saliva related transmembrane protein